MSLRSSLAAFVSLALCACEVSGTTTTYQPYTAVFVDPTDFRGGVACGDDAGAMRSYVVTLVDVTPDGCGRPTRTVVASSPPTSCRQPTAFSQVAPGHYYLAEIDAYDVPACPFQNSTPVTSDGQPCLAPAGPTYEYVDDQGVNVVTEFAVPAWSSGPRAQLLAPGTGERPRKDGFAQPVWTTHCGQVREAGQGGQSGSGGAAGGGAGAGASGAGQAGAGQGGGAGASGAGAGQAGAGNGGAGGAGSGGAGGASAGAGGSGGAAAGGSGADQGGEAGAGQGGEAGQSGAAGAASTCEAQGGGAGSPYLTYDQADPTEAVFEVTARIGGCVPLGPLTGPAVVQISAANLQGGLQCGTDVARFEVTAEGGATRQFDCGENAVYEDLQPGAVYQWQVLAYPSGSAQPRHGFRCTGRAAAGLTVEATCGSPTERGSLRLPGAALCGDGVRSYRTSVVGGPAQQPVSKTCPGDLVLSDQAAGPIEVQADLTGDGGQVLDTVTCTGQVVPGQTTLATCAP